MLGTCATSSGRRGGAGFGQRYGVRVADDPLVAAAVAVCTVLLGVTARYARRRGPPGARLQAHPAARHEVAVLKHPEPGPDATAGDT
jgi:hypothetical protein